MKMFKRSKYLLVSLGIVASIPGLCMANVLEQNRYNTQSELAREVAISSDAVYVSPDGNDNGDGSLAKPYKTINKALSQVKPGQTLYLREGVYNQTITFNTSGKKDAYITVRNYPGEKVVLDNSGSKTEAMIDFNGQSYIHVEGLELQNNKNKWAYGFFLGNGESNIIIKNNTIHDIYASKPSSSNSGANAIICYGERADKSISNILIEGNTVYDCNTGWSEAISITGNCEYVDVINNVVANTGNIGIDFCGNFGYCSDPALDQPRYCTAVGNIISGAHSPNATSYGLYVDGARNILLERNVISNSQGGIEVGAEEPSKYPTQNIIVRNNVVFNNSENGITVGGYYTGGGKAKNIKIYNNTAVNNGSENGELTISVVDGLEVANNIFYSDTDKTLINSEFSSKYTSNVTFSNNLYYSGAGSKNASFELKNKSIKSFENWKASYESTALFGKPDFDTDYSLKSTSIGVDAGNDSIDAGDYDFSRNIRRQGIIDCGAYETIGTTTPVKPEVPVEPEVSEQPETPPAESEQPDMQDNVITVLNKICTLKVGDKHFLKISLDKSQGDTSVTFTTSDRKIAKVSSNGNIQAVSEGDVVITITTNLGKTYVMPLSIVSDTPVEPELPTEPTTPTEPTNPTEPEIPVTPDEEQSENLLPTFNNSTWSFVKDYKDLSITGDYSISLTTPKSWEGISLWEYQGLKADKTYQIGYDTLGADNYVQMWVDGKCLVELTGTQASNTTFTIPKETKVIDICIGSSKSNTEVSVEGIYIK